MEPKPQSSSVPETEKWEELSEATRNFGHSASFIEKLGEERVGTAEANKLTDVFFRALYWLPEMLEEEATQNPDPRIHKMRSHLLARDLYMNGERAVRMQGLTTDNDAVRLVCAQGIVAETQALINLASQSAGH